MGRLLRSAALGLLLTLLGCTHTTIWRPPPSVGSEEPQVVVLVHAIWRWPGYSMRQLWQGGVERGYEVVYFRYSGLRDGLETNAMRLAELLDSYRGRSVSLVTHSYGGLIARRMFERFDFPEVRRLVMIGTPNQGATFANRWSQSLPYQFMFGHGGTQLTTREAQRLAVPPCDFGILAGSGSGINPYALGDNDGVVGVTEAYLPEAQEFRVIDARHEALPNDPGVVQAVYRFLETGTFGLDPGGPASPEAPATPSPSIGG
ncbi:alpha/beta hydrolase [Candidatus Sumerlaeota bacterium]|nr:alpha/beta hydrolase [Candidatus Sumerlaeota bacterium]